MTRHDPRHPAARPTTALLGLVAAALLTGCAGTRGGADLTLYRSYLQRTAPSPAANDAARETRDREALERFLAALRDYSPATMSEQVGELYAVDAYFNDQIKELVGVTAIRDYLVRSAELLVAPEITVQDVVGSGGEYYVRWIMSFRTKRAPDKPATVARGISHLRFDDDGRVSFHEDFWDVTTAIWERVPLAGTLIRHVKGSI